MISLQRFSRTTVSKCRSQTLAAMKFSSLNAVAEERSASKNMHFRVTNVPHPLNAKPVINMSEASLADKIGRQQNHIWNLEELKDKCTNTYHHKPVSMSDHFMRTVMNIMYHSFNFVTGYQKINPTVKSIEWRLIVLESVAGVPGFVAAAFRHFKSLRTISKDYGFIATLLEEAENERMHLLVCFKMFGASYFVRTAVIAAQCILTPTLVCVYLIHPRSMHRFVGYLEETATETYISIINAIETPGTHLNLAWKDTPAPEMALGYWYLPKDAKWVDTLKCICADETHHRDVNHTYANLKEGELNPFLEMHQKDAAIAWRMHETGQTAWPAASSASNPSK